MLPASNVQPWRTGSPSIVRSLASSTFSQTDLRIIQPFAFSSPAVFLKSCSTCAAWACSTPAFSPRAVKPWKKILNWGETSERRQRFREILKQQDGVDADDVIMAPDRAAARGLTSTVTFPRGNLLRKVPSLRARPSIRRWLIHDGIYRKEGPARVFVSEKDAMAAIKQGRIAGWGYPRARWLGPWGPAWRKPINSPRLSSICRLVNRSPWSPMRAFQGFRPVPASATLAPRLSRGSHREALRWRHHPHHRRSQ